MADNDDGCEGKQHGDGSGKHVASTTTALLDDGLGGSTVPEAMETALAYAMGNGTATAAAVMANTAAARLPLAA